MPLTDFASRAPKRRSRLRFLAAASLAASVIAVPASRADEAKPSWQPKAPEGLPADFDWIRLPSDEWLKGEIVSMYDGKLEFDSDELGVHTFDFGDIKELRSSRVVQVGFSERPPVTGRLVMIDKAARVVADAGDAARSGSLRAVRAWRTPRSVGQNRQDACRWRRTEHSAGRADAAEPAIFPRGMRMDRLGIFLHVIGDARPASGDLEVTPAFGGRLFGLRFGESGA
jgi:hypothetical protein